MYQKTAHLCIMYWCFRELQAFTGMHQSVLQNIFLVFGFFIYKFFKIITMYTMLTWYMRSKICTQNEAETLHKYRNNCFNEGFTSENMQENWGKDDITLVHDKETKDGITQLNGEIYSFYKRRGCTKRTGRHILCCAVHREDTEGIKMRRGGGDEKGEGVEQGIECSRNNHTFDTG